MVKEGSNPWKSASIEEQDALARAHGEEVTGEIADLAETAGVEFVSEVRFGPRVYEQINEYVEEADIDLIVMGSGYHGEFGGVLGSTADKVLRTARVPVLSLRREQRARSGQDAAEQTAARRHGFVRHTTVSHGPG